MFYFCHLKKLVRPETFGPYYVGLGFDPDQFQCGFLRVPFLSFTSDKIQSL